MTFIEDGSGNWYIAKVDSDNALHTDATTTSKSDFEMERGNAYNFNTGTVTLTSDSKSALMYMKNIGSLDIVITWFFYLLWNTTGGTAASDILVQVEKNPTGGTLISGGTAATPVNRNFGFSDNANVTALVWAEASTVTWGTVAIESIFSWVGRQAVIVPTVLRPNSSIAITVTPKTSNTNQDVQLAIAFYEKQET